jgi:hypothetical protein
MAELARVLKKKAWLMISYSYWRGQKGGKKQIQTRKSKEGIFQVYKCYYTPTELKELLAATISKVVHLETTPYEILCIARKY